MNYRDSDIQTGIHTRIGHTSTGETMRISSIWRNFANDNFETRAWETFLWEGDRIVQDYQTLYSADDVVDLHFKIVEGKKVNNHE